MSGDGRELGEAQREHGQRTYGSHPGMYGQEPSLPARHAAGVFREAGAVDVLEPGAGHGRDALYFARECFTVRALDFSAAGLEQLRADVGRRRMGGRATTAVREVHAFEEGELPRRLWRVTQSLAR
ncbi:hypothetical protein [Streptomyces sp. NPDC047985]|uniref:hypothetical protein n=1 Tax=unclassified Streptomyces TaxID=2593676 RepID=UPI00342F8A70